MKKTIALLVTIITLTLSSAVFAEGGVTYTFKGNNVITDGSPNDITDVALTKDINVTTSGNMNRKYVGITDLKHNNEVGTFPANSDFKATGSYIYLGCANANDGSIITLSLPEIKKGSKVTLTFAKPTVTNNGSTLRNTNDPYAYLKIADRYISINGDNFDEWRTESVVTGEDTNEIVFYADKWGAVAISKIEISDGDGKPLHNLNISSTQYTNLTVNGIKFCTDENGKITLPSYPAGEEIGITAYKDGYETKEISQTMPDKDIDISIPLDVSVDAVYYESDFGNTVGILALDGEYKFGDGIEAADVTKIFGRLTFTDGGCLTAAMAKLTYSGDGIYLNNEKVTSKDNMEFELYFDKSRKLIFLKQNDEYTKIENADANFDIINAIEGKNVTLEYIGITYPDTTKITIEGPEKIASLPQGQTAEKYELKAEYYIPGTEVDFYTSESDFASIYNSEIYEKSRERMLIVQPASSSKVTIYAEYNGAKVSKDIEIIYGVKLTEWESKSNTLNLNSSKKFGLSRAVDELGHDYTRILKDFKSSDESVIKIDQNGMMTAVGKGKATITANAYTGVDNIISVAYTVDQFYICGFADGETTYVTGDLVNNEHITGYEIDFGDGTIQTIEKTQIPAATIKEDGIAVTAHYISNHLAYVESEHVSAGDSILVSNGTKKVYLLCDGKIEEITEADTTIEGYEITHENFEFYSYEISPVYAFTDMGDVAEGKTLDGIFADGLYDITFKKAETKRGDIFVNGYMVGNNVDQADADRKVTDGALYKAEDIKINDGIITVSMTDGSTLLDYVTVKKRPSPAMRLPEFRRIESAPFRREERVYIIGDSLACNYYGDFEQEVGGGRTGWGQVLENYLTIPVTNLANSGQFAKGLYDTAFPSVIENGEYGDICLIEVGYNDRSYSTRDEMITTVKAMVTECREKGITPILVTPNASAHDYKPSVSWSSYLRDVAVDMSCPLIDLSQLSYDFLYSLYGDDADSNITKNYNLTEVGGDTLHSSYAAANVWASIVAQAMKDMKHEWNHNSFYNTDYTYTFTDTLGNTITAKVE